MVVKIEGRGNGIKTNIVNNVDIAKALNRPPEYFMHYFKSNTGSQIIYDTSTCKSVINGSHSIQTLEKELEGYIKRYVQCYTCGNPETIIHVTKKNTLCLECIACGSTSKIDSSHRTDTFIIKKQCNHIKEKKTKVRLENPPPDSQQQDDDDNIVWMSDTSKEAAEKRAKEQLSSATCALVKTDMIKFSDLN